jgi:hypothetical protein
MSHLPVLEYPNQSLTSGSKPKMRLDVSSPALSRASLIDMYRPRHVRRVKPLG